MGQSTSRHRPASQQSSSTLQPSSSSNNTLTENDQSVAVSPSPKQSRRASVRKSILNLVKPKTSRPLSGTSSTIIPQESTSQRRWRHSRLWDKSDRPQTATETTNIAGPSDLQTAIATVTEKELERNPDLSQIEAPTTQPPVVSTATPDLSSDDTLVIGGQNASEALESRPREHGDDQGTLPNRLGLSPEVIEQEDEVVISPEQFLQDPPASGTADPTPTEQEAASQTPPTRQFPPPGTLVVVQGVVHTTDLPRAAQSSPETTPNVTVTEPPAVHRRASSTPRPASPANPERRNRLSALLHSRPTSIVGERPSSVAGTSERRRSVAASISSVAPDASSEVTPTLPVPTAAVAEPVDATSTTARSPISSSSIDVLGTLLSVAAAATAASLLTGSSEPMLGQHSNTPAADAAGLLSRPSPGVGVPLGLGTDLPGTPAGQRMRQAWGNIRERLGLRPSGSLATPGDARDPFTPGPSEGVPVDARERMLAEMARAFNLGLGLTGEALNSPSAESDSTGSESIQPQPVSLPPEGSFERFLVDLQSDLRAALTRDPTLGAQDQSPSEEEPEQNGATHRGPHHAAQDVPGSDTDDDESFDDDGEDVEDSEDTSPTSPNPDSPSGTINWWRLYRFPPIPAPRAQASAEAVVNVRSAPSPASSLVSSPLSPSSPPSQLDAESVSLNTPLESTPDHPLPIASDTNPNTLPRPALPNVVVPVIVVGLQSVQLNWQSDAPSAPAPPSSAEPEADPADALAGTGPEHDGANTEDEPVTARAGPGGVDTRGRRWHSRAANALRNLRPSHQPSPTGTQEGDVAGTRTFLIYVIGGYYPPDHSIVTGEPNNLDSFEALLDLAELLGQVKSPTVSKEEIDKCNLEVIKSTLVPQYETEGKISSNCTERCLICLDDYQPEDDVRVMSCRHAFHKDCVDTWLQTGKNNCPACRSKGVSGETSTST